MKRSLFLFCLLTILSVSGCSSAGTTAETTAETSTETTAETTAEETEASVTEVEETEEEIETEEETGPVPNASPEIVESYYISPKNIGALKIDGGTLCDSDSIPLQIKGVQIDAAADAAPYFNAELFGEMRSDWGVNTIRIAMPADDGENAAADLELVKTGIRLASDADMYVIVDWELPADGDVTACQEAVAEFFRTISSEYKDQTNILYEICSDPVSTWDEIKAYAGEVIAVIRENASDAVVICGSPDKSRDYTFPAEDPLEQDNIIYTYHANVEKDDDEARSLMAAYAQAGMPLFATDLMISDGNDLSGDLKKAGEWMGTMDENNISICAMKLSNSGDPDALIAASCTAASGFSEDDFSESGKWFLRKLQFYKEISVIR